jgi:anaerobic magnesium-protoporphyrin IX monomethyl ester cyclase
MKAVLIIPPSPWLISDRDQPLTGILYIASYLKSRGYEVQVCDLSGMTEENWYIPIGHIYGITGVTPNFPYVKKIIDTLKTREPTKMVVVGGVHATVLPQHVLDNTKADVCVIGEGENTFLELMEGKKSLKNIDGIVTREFTTKPRKLEKNLDVFPYPDRNSIDYYSYLVPQTYKYLSSDREGSIITSRGCPYNCAYCGSYKMHGGKVRFRSADDVFSELLHLKSHYDIGLCNFVDDTFILNKKRLIEICDYIKKLDIKWFFLTRTDHVDLKLFEKMVDSGCVSVTFGFESGSNKILDVMNKRTTVEQSYEAIKISKKAGLKIRGQMMVGLPFEEDEDIELTADFIKNSREVDAIGLHVFQPYPGCDVWRNPEKYEWDLDEDFINYHTIGKVGDKLTKNKKIQERYEYLKGIIADRSIEFKGALDEKTSQKDN